LHDKLPLVDFDSPTLSIDDIENAYDAMAAWHDFTAPRKP